MRTGYQSLVYDATSRANPKDAMLSVMLLTTQVIEADDSDERATDGGALRSAIAAVFERWDNEAWKTANNEYDKWLDEE